MLTFGSTQALLTSATTQSIQGTLPYLKLPNGTKLANTNESLGFTMPDGHGGIQQIDATYNANIMAPLGMMFSDVVTLVTADNIVHSIAGSVYGDDEGDGGAVSGTMMAVWKHGNTVISDLNQTLSTCSGGTFTLTLNTNNVKAESIYGDPRSNPYASGSKIYTFVGQDAGLCYLKPANMTIQTRNTAYSGGYDAAVFDKDNGFIYEALAKKGYHFPQTGYFKASFALIGSGNAADWTCTKTNESDPVDLGGTGNCTVQFTSLDKPTSEIKINMAHSSGAVTRYTMPVPTLWAREKYMAQYATTDVITTATSFPAATLCNNGIEVTTAADAKNFFFKRSEITNTPLEFGASGSYSRAADTTFMGEWGQEPWHVYSGGSDHSYWTSEAHPTHNAIYTVYTHGSIFAYKPTLSTGVVICR